MLGGTQVKRKDRFYLCIDLKSFYASIECRERQLDPMTTNLVVADSSRTEKTICLAVSPSLKQYGISGRARLFEVVQQVKRENGNRLRKLQQLQDRTAQFTNKSYDDGVLVEDPSVAIDYIVAPPRMATYVQYSTKIYEVYLKYLAPEDMHVYSIDEVFMDVTDYLNTYQMTARELGVKIIRDVYESTGITATAGIGSNLYLGKIAMDIVAKHIEPDEYGARIAELDEEQYRELLWSHHPITDFWRVGKGYANRLAKLGLYTMGDVARCSVGKPTDYYNEELLYKEFGINAELLIDHAWGWESCTMADIRGYKPKTSSICAGQVLPTPYTCEDTRLVVREMVELLALNLVSKQMVTNQIVLTIGYDIENLTDSVRGNLYRGERTIDQYGRAVPKSAHGTGNLTEHTASTKKIATCVMELYDRIINPSLLVRRIQMSANHLQLESEVKQAQAYHQYTLFDDFQEEAKEKEADEKEKKLQETMLNIQGKYGKNAILKGMNLQKNATTIERNGKLGGHQA